MSVLVVLGWWFGLSLAAGVVLGQLLDQLARATTTAPAPVRVLADTEGVRVTASPAGR